MVANRDAPAASDPLPVRAARRRWPRLSLRHKALFVLVLAIAASLDAVYVVQRNFQRVGEHLRLIAEVELPALGRAAELARAAHRLSGAGTALLTRPTPHLWEEIDAESARIMAEAQTIVAHLRAQGFATLDPATLDDLETRFAAIARSLRLFSDTAARAAMLAGRGDDQALRLHRLSQQVTDLGSDPNADGCLGRWQTHARAAIIELLVARNARYPARLRERQQGVDAALIGMQQAGMQQAGACTAPGLRLQDQLAALGGAEGLIALRDEQLRRQLELDGQLRHALHQVDALMTQVDDLMRTSQAAARGYSGQLDQLVAESVALIALVPLVLLGITIVTFSYLNRSLLRPIRQLQAALAERRAGRAEVAFPNAGVRELDDIVTDVRATLDTLAARERELAQAKAAVERASQAKSRFLAHMSHELRAPLNVVLGQTQLLDRHAPPDSDAHARCAAIRRSSTHLLALISDLLDIAAIEAGALRPQMAPVDLPMLLHDLTLGARSAAVTKGLAFDAALAPGLPPTIRTDGRRLRQILQNLLDNAVKYTERGRVQLHVAMTPTGGPAGDTAGQPVWLAFVIADTGAGIPEGEHARLFEAFEQLRPGQPGTGLGLAISQELTTLLGGRLTLDSAPGRGTRFRVELPVLALAAPPSASSSARPRRVALAEVCAPCEAPGPPLPPRLELDTALELAATADWPALRDWCADLAAGEPRLAPFAAQVRAQLDAGGVGLWDWLQARRGQC